MKLASNIPEGPFTGEVTVIDPWDDQHLQKIAVRGEPVPLIKVAPTRIMLNANRSDNREVSADFLVLTKDSSLEVSVEPRGLESPLLIRPESGRGGAGRGGSMARYSVRLKPGPVHPGVFEIAVRLARPSVDPVVVSVLVRKGDAR